MRSFSTMILLILGFTLGAIAQEKIQEDKVPVYPLDREIIIEQMANGTFDKEAHDKYVSSIHQNSQLKSGGGGGGSSSSCSCYQEPDDTYIELLQSQFQPNALDGSVGPYPIGFPYCFFGDDRNQFWINTKGTITFDGPNTTFVPTGFPDNTFSMIAGFWADLDIRGVGEIYYKITPTAVYVNFVDVGYYNFNTNLTNSFQIIITDGSDPVIGVGNNLALCYKDMQWAAGEWNGGVGGFGGTAAATVGANRGSANDFFQVGRFISNSTNYDGPFGANDGVNWLDCQSFILDACFASDNIPPIPSTSIVGDTLYLCQGDTVDIDVQFFAPEEEQTVTIDVDASDAPGFELINEDEGVFAEVNGQVVGSADNIGSHTLVITGTDDGTPVQSTTVTFTIIISDIEIPSLSVEGVTEFCGGGSTVLTASDGFDSYVWDAGCPTQACEIESGGIVTVTGFFQGCETSTSIEVEETAFFIPDFESFSSPICSNDTSTVCIAEDELDNYESFAWDIWADSEGIIYGDTTGTCADVSAGTFVVYVETPAGCVGQRIFSVGATDANIPDDSFSGVYCDGLEDVEFCCGSSEAGEGLFRLYLDTNNGPWVEGATLDVLINGEVTSVDNEIIGDGPYPTATQLLNSNGQIILEFSIVYGDQISVIYESNGSEIEIGLNANNCTFSTFNIPLSTEGGEVFSDFAGCFFSPAPGDWEILSGPDGASLSDTVGYNTVFTPAEHGVYELEFFSSTCNIAYPYTLEFNELPTVSVLEDDILSCDEGEVTLNGEVSSILNDATFLWLPNEQNDLSISVSESDTYSLLASNNCGTVQDSVEVNILPTPTASLEDALICNGEPLILDPVLDDDPSFVYEWSGLISDEAEVQVDQSGTYSVIVSNDCGSSEAIANLSALPVPDVVDAFSDTLFLCADELVILNPVVDDDESFNYEWSISSTDDEVEVGPGEYSVVVSNECGSDSGEVSVLEIPLPFAALSDAALCPGESTVLDPISEDDESYSYSWTGIDSSDPEVTVDESGNYGVEVSNDCGSSSANIEVTSIPLPEVNLTNSQACEGETINLDPIVEDDDSFSYEWTGVSSNSSSVDVGPGEYTVEVSNNCGSDTGSASVSEIPEPIAILEDLIVCSGESALLDPVANDDETYLYSWTGISSSEAEVSIDEPGDYSVEVSNDCGSSTASSSVTLIPSPTNGLLETVILCDGDSTLLNAVENPSSDFEYSWSTGESGESIWVNETGAYQVEVTTVCEDSDIFNTEVEASITPSVLISSDTLRVCPGIVEQIDDVDYSGSISDIYWEFDGFEFSDEENPTVVSEDVPGDFVNTGLMMYVDVSGPCGTAQDSIFILPTTCSLWGFNIFTPNNDGDNDFFVIGGAYLFDSVQLKVYNRWGNLVYQDDDYENDWDADGLESGTYYYIAVVPNGGPSLDGHFTLVR